MDFTEEQQQAPENKIKLPLISVGLIIGYFISQSICFSLIAVATGTPLDSNFPKNLLFQAIALNAFIWIILSIYLMPRLGLPKENEKKNDLTECVKHYFIGLGLMYASMIFVGLLLQLMDFQPKTQDVAGQVKAMGESNLFLALIGPAILIPIIEEFLFRGILFRALKLSCSAFLAALISALLFGLVHIEIDTMPQLAILGFVFAYIYEKSGSIWVASALHATNNFITIMILVFVPDLDQKLQSVVFFLPVFGLGSP